MTTSDQSEKETNRYEGTRGTFRLLKEGVELLIQDAVDVWSIIVGSAPKTGEKCDMKGCDGDAVTTFSSGDEWRDDYDACRKCWLKVRGGIVAVFVGLLLVASLAWVIVL